TIAGLEGKMIAARSQTFDGLGVWTNRYRYGSMPVSWTVWIPGVTKASGGPNSAGQTRKEGGKGKSASGSEPSPRGAPASIQRRRVDLSAAGRARLLVQCP